jgi:hypothetical protein
MLLLLLLLVQSAETSLSRFLYWGTHDVHKSGQTSTPLTVIPHAIFCNSATTAVLSLRTVFEGNPHQFGITACDDNRIFIGLRITEAVLIYMEFESFTDFEAFMRCVFAFY